MNIKDVAEKLNSLAGNHEFGELQSLRKEVKSLTKPNTYKIFSQRSIFEEHDYAFHSGGRTEFQYNIGFENDQKKFRYCLAFSIESSKSLQDPVNILKPKIDKFNAFLKTNPEYFQDFKLWYYHKSNRIEFPIVTTIENNLIKKDTFIVIGKYFNKYYDDLTDDDYFEILSTFDYLLPVYKFVESKNETKISRICWNDNNWVKPSGKIGKSQNKKSFEYKHGYGHEEWLLDLEKIINGYHYGFLETINKHKNIYENQMFDISLYSINSETGERWWIGNIKNVRIITREESNEIFSHYKKAGWLNEMRNQIKKIGGDLSEFDKLNSNIFFNIKFTPYDLELLDCPLKFDKNDKAVTSTYYTLLNKKSDPEFDIPINTIFNFQPGHHKSKYSTTVNYGERNKDLDLVHNRVKDNIYNQLVKIYGKQNVATEHPTGFGTKIDIVINISGKIIFYEVKTSNSLKVCIREALSQLIEYAYWPDQDRARKLVIVSLNIISEQAKKYLEKIRKDFYLPVYYQRYNPEIGLLEQEEY